MLGIAFVLLATASPLKNPAFFFGDEYTAPRSATVSTSGATKIVVDARAGSLRIEGRAGLTEMRAHGTARAESKRLLEDIKLIAERQGNEVIVRAEIPERGGWGWGIGWAVGQVALLDLVIEVPIDMPLDVSDSSGDVEIRDVAALDISDSSGDLVIERVGGRLRIDDSSGELRVRGVHGDVYVRDSSGGIDIVDVQGSVEVEDDSSGSIDVRDVTGSFTVAHDGSGSIDYDNVRGRISVPKNKR